MEMWFSEFHTPDVKHSIRVNRQLYSKQSDYQRIDIFETPEFGRVLTLDGNVMLTERDEFIYDEMITHVPMAIHKEARDILVIGAGDGGVVRELTRYDRVRHIDLVEMDPMRGTAPGMTIEENLALAAGKGGWLSHTTRQEKERFREELKKLDIGLEERMSHPVGLLSGGQRQALTLLMATMNPPKLLLLDEHTAALDPGTAEKVLNLTRRIVEEHQLTCLMITHNMQSAIDLGNRILMMDSGNIVLDIGGEEKKNMTVDGLLEKFKTGAGKALDNDRILLSD